MGARNPIQIIVTRVIANRFARIITQNNTDVSARFSSLLNKDSGLIHRANRFRNPLYDIWTIFYWDISSSIIDDENFESIIDKVFKEAANFFDVGFGFHDNISIAGLSAMSIFF